MAQRRSRNRRLSSRKSNVSGFLNEDTNVIDNNDPLWFDRTVIRPSTSLHMSKNTTAILDPDSTIHTSQLPEDWFEDLSQSESTKLLQEAVKNKKSKQHEEPADSDHGHRSAATESESEHEFQKKRANLRSTRKLSNKTSDKSNAFMKALEKTTDSHTRNLTHAQMLEGNESESTYDDSRTVAKIRPKFTRRAKNDTNNFDKALESDSALERVETSRRSLRSASKRISEINEEFATPEKQRRLTRSVIENIADTSHGKKSVEKVQNKSVNKSRDKTIVNSSVRELRNRSIVSTPDKSATPSQSLRKSSGTKKKSAEKNQSPDSSSNSPEVEKRKRQLFSRGNKSTTEKSKGDKSAFDAALDSVNVSQKNDATITEAASTFKANEKGEASENDDDDDSDSSSIPQKIRRTRSRSLFGERNSDETKDVNSSKNKSKTRERSSVFSGRNSGEIGDASSSKNKSRTQERDSSKGASQSSKHLSAANDSNVSDKQESTLKNLTIAESSDDDEDIYTSSLNRKNKSIIQERNSFFDKRNSSTTGDVNSSKNISKTRERSFMFGDRNSSEIGDVSSSKNKSRTQERDSSKGASQSSKHLSAANDSNVSDKQGSTLKNLTIAESSDDDEDIYTSSLNRSKVTKQSKTNKSDKSNNDKVQVTSVETSEEEDMVDPPPSKIKQFETNKSDKQQVSSIETSDDEDMINLSTVQIEPRMANTSKKSNELIEKTNKSRGSKSTTSGEKDDDIPSSPESPTRKSRSRLFQKKNLSNDENAFDKISFNKSSPVKRKSKEIEIEETPRLSQRSPKAKNKSQKNQSVDVSKNKSSSQENTENDSKEDESEDDTSTIPQHIRRTRSRLFQKSKAADVDDNTFGHALGAENVPENRSESNQKLTTLNNSTNKTVSIMRDAGPNKSILLKEAMKKKPKIIFEKIIQPDGSVDLSPERSKQNQESRRTSPRKTAVNTSLNKENEVNNSLDAANNQRSIETSSDETSGPTHPKQTSTPFTAPLIARKPSKRVSIIPNSAKSNQNGTFDDLLDTPNPAQSTLNPHGKPVNRITQFSFRTFADLEERTLPAAAEILKTQSNAIPENNEDVDVTGESEVINGALLSRHPDDIPPDKEDSDMQVPAPVVSKSPKKAKQTNRSSSNNIENEHSIDWEKVKQHTDAVKVMVAAQMRLAEEARKKHELEKQRMDAKLKRIQAQREADLKRKNKKPIHKAYLVNGEVYKQPKLPRPKSWATDRLYKYLWKKMNPKFGLRTRVKSEEFVVQLSDFATRISKRKKFENYRKELDEIMMTMAKLGIIETRFDFYRFTADFLPYSFREKVNPMMMPGNERNIPFEPELLHKPLLSDLRSSQESDTDEL